MRARNIGELYNGKKSTDLSFEAHLVSSDKEFVLLRRLLQSAVRDVQEGRDPPLSFGRESILIET